MLDGMGDETARAADHVSGSGAPSPAGGADPGAGAVPVAAVDGAWPERWRGHDVRRLLGSGLVVLWVAFITVLWVGQVRLVPLSTLADDLAAGKVVGHREVVLNLDGDSGSRWTGSHVLDYTTVDESGRLTDPESDTSGRGEVAVSYRVEGAVATQRVVDPRSAGSADAADAIALLRAAGIPADAGFGSDFHGRGDRAAQLALALGAVALALIVLGPRPGRGTRWFWFWLLWAPLALGVLAYAVVELVRPGRPRRPEVGRRRHSGLLGVLVTWLGGALLAMVLSDLADLAPVLLVRP